MTYKVNDLMLYNMDLKIAGEVVTIKTYEKIQSYNYPVIGSRSRAEVYNEITKEYEDLISCSWTSSRYYNVKLKQKLKAWESYGSKKERFIKSCRRSKERIFDLIAANAGKWKDYAGRSQTTKFLTLTFKANVTDLAAANLEVTNFMKRLSYNIYKDNKKVKTPHKNVIKYVCVPELQARGAWHYHMVLFNSPYLVWKDLKEIWGKGGVYIQALPAGLKATSIARYITKYISKGIEIEEDRFEYQEKGKIVKLNDVLKYNEVDEDDPDYKEKCLGEKRLSDFENYIKLGLENAKRYQCSRGLIQPIERKLKLSRSEWGLFVNYMISKAKKMDKFNKKENRKESITTFYHNEYNNEHRGQINITVAEMDLEDIKAMLHQSGLIWKDNRSSMTREVKPDYDYIKNNLNKIIEEKKADQLQLQIKKIIARKLLITNYPKYLNHSSNMVMMKNLKKELEKGEKKVG